MSYALSIIIPAYNEATRIGPTLDEVLDFYLHAIRTAPAKKVRENHSSR